MGNVIQTNVASLAAQKNIFKANTGLATTFSRLSSGFRINSAKDDASGLVISNALTKEANGSKMALRNANDGISFAQIADGALNEVTNILLRMRDLSLSAWQSIHPITLFARYFPLSTRSGVISTFRVSSTGTFGSIIDTYIITPPMIKIIADKSKKTIVKTFLIVVWF